MAHVADANHPPPLGYSISSISCLLRDGVALMFALLLSAILGLRRKSREQCHHGSNNASSPESLGELAHSCTIIHSALHCVWPSITAALAAKQAAAAAVERASTSTSGAPANTTADKSAAENKDECYYDGAEQ
eukprot:6210995-Pleurochrysis_carterae.AAC.1